jgi:hypothetical protein
MGQSVDDRRYAAQGILEDNVRKAEAIAASPNAPDASPADAVLDMTALGGEPIFFAYSPTARMVFLCEHNGGVTKIGGKKFSETVPRGGDPADVAQALWLRSKGTPSADPYDFDGPIDYTPGALRLPRGRLTVVPRVSCPCNYGFSSALHSNARPLFCECLAEYDGNGLMVAVRIFLYVG